MRVIIGWLLYLIDPNFRRLVNAKRRRGANDQVGTGEKVVAVLKRG